MSLSSAQSVSLTAAQLTSCSILAITGGDFMGNLKASIV